MRVSKVHGTNHKMGTNLLGLVSCVHNTQLDREVIIERGKVIIASFINVDIRPSLLDVRRARAGRRDILIWTPAFYLVENS